MDPLFDHEKLDVYCVELGFVAWIAAFLDDASKSACRHRRELIEQLDRASLSVLLNTAEGNGKRQGRHRAKFFDDARGSALECAACLDAAVAKGLVSADRVCPGKQMLARVVAMLSRLIDRFNSQVPDLDSLRTNYRRRRPSYSITRLAFLAGRARTTTTRTSR
jgi:four helix bundle protein